MKWCGKLYRIYIYFFRRPGWLRRFPSLYTKLPSAYLVSIGTEEAPLLSRVKVAQSRSIAWEYVRCVSRKSRWRNTKKKKRERLTRRMQFENTELIRTTEYWMCIEILNVRISPYYILFFFFSNFFFARVSTSRSSSFSHFGGFYFAKISEMTRGRSMKREEVSVGRSLWHPVYLLDE